MYRSEDIRKAMQMLADDRGRQYFEKVVIDDVVEAYRNGLDHPLKKEVDLLLPRFARVIKKDEFVPTKQLRSMTNKEQFKQFLKFAHLFLGSQKMLSRLSGVGTSTICNAIKKGYMLQATYEKMQPHFAELAKYYEESNPPSRRKNPKR